jgi:signal transduction histidine kinase
MKNTNSQELVEQTGNLLGLASHELRTPLASIKAFAELLEKRNKEQLDEKSLHYLKKIHDKIAEQMYLISDITDVTKIHLGVMSFYPELFCFDTLVDEVVEDQQVLTDTHQIRKKGQSDKNVLADKERIRQVINNLILNAIKYSPEGKYVDVMVEEQKGEIVLEVKDYGIGITAAEQKRVFEPYFQSNKLKKRQGARGLGVGLYISAEIMRQQDGRIRVDSTLGKGSTFYIALPVKT